ncbi:GntR family transcriptional regulator [Castellaniella sp.]|uniref:GntR family transcriptional regulator n=1 Tax=Castellaniella sp. TaxID=1955812 RepID=UPI003A9169B9
MTPDSLASSALLSGSLPLYQVVKQRILDALASKEWKQGDALPSEKFLASHFGVSIGTLRKAVDELAAEGILIRHQGRGTFVAMHSRNSHFFRFFRIVRQDDNERAYPQSEMVRFRRMRATEEIRRKLDLKSGAYAFEYVNLQRLHGLPVIVDTIWLPEASFRGLTEQRVSERPSTIYSFYQEAFGINVIGTVERVRIAQADAEHAQLMQVGIGYPLLEVRRVAYSFNRRPVEWRVSRVNTDAYEYVGQDFRL